MRKRGSLVFLLLCMIFISGCSSYFGDKVKGVNVDSDETLEDADALNDALKYGVKPFLDCEILEGKDRDYCLDLQANDPANLDENYCENIQDEGLRQYCKDRVCMFAGNCQERTIGAYHIDFLDTEKTLGLQPYVYASLDLQSTLLADSRILEFSSEEYEAIKNQDKKIVNGRNYLFNIKSPEGMNFALLNIKLNSGSIQYYSPVKGVLSPQNFQELIYVRTFVLDGRGNPLYRYLSSKEYQGRNPEIFSGWGDSISVIIPVVDGKISFIIPHNSDYATIIDNLYTEIIFGKSMQNIVYRSRVKTLKPDLTFEEN